MLVAILGILIGLILAYVLAMLAYDELCDPPRHRVRDVPFALFLFFLSTAFLFGVAAIGDYLLGTRLTTVKPAPMVDVASPAEQSPASE